MNERTYQSLQCRIRAARLITARAEDRCIFDKPLHEQVQKAREALEQAEEISAFRLVDSEKVA